MRMFIRTNIRLQQENLHLPIYAHIVRVEPCKNMKEKTNVTIHKTIKAGSIIAAREEGRSLSGLVERLLERHLESRGALPSVLHEDPSGYAKKIKAAKSQIKNCKGEV
jgi:hypothetical protein